MLQKLVYPYEFMNDWGKFYETSLPEKENFCSHLNMEEIIGADYVHTKRFCKDFEKKRKISKWNVLVNWCISEL